MDRLTSRQTIKHFDGTEHVETYCHGHRYGPAAFSQKYGTSNQQEYKDYCKMVDRLAAYEDTALEPSEIPTALEPSEIPTALELANVFAALQEFKQYKDAEEQGRLVELPCKVNDTVYTNMQFSGSYLRKKDKPYSVNVVFVGLNGDASKRCGFFNVVYSTEHMRQFDFSDIGKTVFLTKAEAQAALERMEGQK